MPYFQLIYYVLFNSPNCCIILKNGTVKHSTTGFIYKIYSFLICLVLIIWVTHILLITRKEENLRSNGLKLIFNEFLVKLKNESVGVYLASFEAMFANNPWYDLSTFMIVIVFCSTILKVSSKTKFIKLKHLHY